MCLDKMLKKIPFSETNIKTDSRQINAGDVFVAIKGYARDGHDYILDVLKDGASFVVCEKEPEGLFCGDQEKIIVVENTRVALGDIAKHIFGDPSKSLFVCGVTGTNGKTTTVFLIDSILNNAARNCGFVSTVFIKTSGNNFVPASLTTPDVVSLNRFLSEMVSDGKEAVIVEISSHALSQKRVCGIGLDCAVVTNITPEHLDYHKNMETYLRDKSNIFRYLKSGGTSVINFDDPMVMGLKATINFSNLITFGFSDDADVMAQNVELCADKTEFDLIAGQFGSIHVSSGLIGKHNIYNMLAAAAALLNSGLSLDEMKDGLEKALPVPGRLEILQGDAPFKVFVDYAHTPDALKNMLSCLRSLAANRLICVFGCGGDRDITKRPVMGKIASGFCDRIILTNDNPRTEKPGEIIRQIEKGVLEGTDCSIIEERFEAIREAFKSAKDGDMVVIAGKGHEDYQIIGDIRRHFSDKETAIEVLKEMGYGC